MLKYAVLCASALLLFAGPMTASASAVLPTLGAAEELYQIGSFTQSIALLDKLLRSEIADDKRREALYLLALNFFSTGNSPRAQAALQDLLDFDPDFQIPVLSSPSVRSFFERVKSQFKIIPRLEHTFLGGIEASAGARIDVTMKRMRKGYEPKLFFRKAADPYFSKVDFTRGAGDTFSARLPPSILIADRGYTLEYFVVVSEGERPLTQLRSPQSPFSVSVNVPVTTASLPLHKRWYFWVALIGGAVVAAGATTTIYLVDAQQRGGATVRFDF